MDPVKDLPKTSRRNLMCWGITGATVGLIGPLLAGCGSSALPPPTTAPAATSAPASAPAAAPTAAAPQASRPTPAAAQPTTVSQASAAAPSGPQEIIVADAFFSTGNTAGDLAELDPARRGTWGFESLLWAPLVASDAETNPLPAKSLAASWETSEDGKTYTFHLRPEAKFSDGKPITAQDVVDSIGYLAMMNHNEARGYRDNFASAAQRFFYDVEGFLDVANKVPYDPFGTPAVPGVKATDDHTVQITIMAPSATFIKRVMFAVGVFRKSDLEAARNMKLDQLDFWSAHAANSGQYKLSKAVPGDHYEMVPNENYFGPPGKLTKITVKAVGSDPNTLLTAYGSKQLDLVALPLTGATVKQALADANLTKDLKEIPNWQVYQYWITPNAPLDDEHARRAFTMAIDRQALINILNAGSSKPLYAPVNMHRNPALPSCQQQTAQVKPLPFDPASAKKELAQSKYAANATSMEINLLSMNSSDLIGLQAVQKMLQDNLGLQNVKIHTEKVANLMNPPFKLHLWPNSQMPWVPDVTDTLWNMAFYIRDKDWAPQEPRPYIAVAYEPQLKTLVSQARSETDEAKHCQLVQQAGQMWNDTAFSLDYAVPISYYLISPSIKNASFYVNGGQGVPEAVENWEIVKS